MTQETKIYSPEAEKLSNESVARELERQAALADDQHVKNPGDRRQERENLKRVIQKTQRRLP